MTRTSVRNGRAFDDWLQALEVGILSPAEVLRRTVTGAPPPAAGAAEPPAAVRGTPGDPLLRQRDVDAVLAELDALTGLAAVKRKVREAYALARVQELRRQAGLTAAPPTLHLAFTGHPGTGKTTVARLVGRLYGAAGLLTKGHLVEVERADLVGEYIGHTALRTRDTLRRALGGVLFIDEAYSLARGGDKDFGHEAIDCLVRGMEEHRHDLAVILAGYPAEMAWLLEQNPGLHSRIPVRIHFPDFSAPELLRITQQMFAAREYRLEPGAVALLAEYLLRHWPAYTGAGGNGRAVRNLVDRAVSRQALRLLGVSSPGREALIWITRADLEEALRR